MTSRPDRVLAAALVAVAALPAVLVGQDAADATPPDAGGPGTVFYGTATVRERPVDSATAAVTVLDRQEIEALDADSVADLLAFVPGVLLETAGTRGGLTTATIRGGDPNFTRVLIDGVPVNDGTYEVGGVFDLEALPASAVERIEVVRGPLSAYYGSTGLAGAINVITRRGRPGPPRGEARVAAGDASYAAAETGLSGGGEHVDWFVGLVHQDEARRIAEERFDLDQLQGRLDRSLGAGGHLEVAGRAASWSADDYPEASGGPVYGSGELRHGDHREASLGAHVNLGRHRLTLAAYRHDLDRTSPAIPPLVPASDESTRFTRLRLGWAWTPIARDALRVSFGADAERERGTNESTLTLFPGPGGEVPGDYSTTRTTPGAYTEVVAHHSDLELEIGARLDLPEGEGPQWSPRLGASWRPGGGATRLRASVGRAFKLPSFFALASPPALGGNPDLRPEVMVGADAGVERRFEAAGVEAGVGVFVNRFRDLVDFDFESFRHVNRSRVEARGVEAHLAWRPRGPVSLALDLTRQEVEDRDTGQPLRLRPDGFGGLRLGWRPRAGVSVELDASGVSSFRDQELPVPERTRVDGRLVWGAAASWPFTGSWALRVRMDNLTDAAYQTLVGFPGAGRSLRVGLGWAPD